MQYNWTTVYDLLSVRNQYSGKDGTRNEKVEILFKDL